MSARRALDRIFKVARSVSAGVAARQTLCGCDVPGGILDAIEPHRSHLNELSIQSRDEPLQFLSDRAEEVLLSGQCPLAPAPPGDTRNPL
jgi:hypothetical protein